VKQPTGPRAPRDDVPRLRPAPRLMVRESVYDAVKRLLMDHALEPGTRLSIDGLARDLEVSPTPVREALFRCEAEGLVIRRANAGYSAAPLLGRGALADLYDLRLMLEPTTAGRSAARANRETVETMRAAVEAGPAEMPGDTYDAYRDFANHDALLHNTIAETGGNSLVAETLRRLRAHTHSYRLYFRRGIAMAAVDEHRAIVAAIAMADENGAERAMRRHLEASRKRLLDAYDSGAVDSTDR
jgi:DNA-binding GntR family transcriptional regulator